ncbi:hypothetical protein [Streptomyces sp. NPDC094032]|uniref:hypothetical protein n=1 Tax=Streptomyces sp. NPDC094032 TaxID=3155308 RepID=UPI0033253806
MRPRTSAAAVTLAATLAALATLTGCGASGDGGGKAGNGTRPTAASAALPGAALPAPRTAPPPAPLLSPAPRRGDVRVEEGPFTDRVRFTRLALHGRQAVTGHLAITSDVSDVIALELRAAFYDADGRLLGSGVFTYGEEHEGEKGGQGGQGGHTERRATGPGIDFSVTAKNPRATPASAVLSVPVLVNE